MEMVGAQRKLDMGCHRWAGVASAVWVPHLLITRPQLLRFMTVCRGDLRSPPRLGTGGEGKAAITVMRVVRESLTGSILVASRDDSRPPPLAGPKSRILCTHLYVCVYVCLQAGACQRCVKENNRFLLYMKISVCVFIYSHAHKHGNAHTHTCVYINKDL